MIKETSPQRTVDKTRLCARCAQPGEKAWGGGGVLSRFFRQRRERNSEEWQAFKQDINRIAAIVCAVLGSVAFGIFLYIFIMYQEMFEPAVIDNLFVLMLVSLVFAFPFMPLLPALFCFYLTWRCAFVARQTGKRLQRKQPYVTVLMYFGLIMGLICIAFLIVLFVQMGNISVG